MKSLNGVTIEQSNNIPTRHYRITKAKPQFKEWITTFGVLFK